MRAASRESLGQLRADWPTLTTGVGQNWAELAEELRQVVGLFAAEPGLRRALADPASPQHAQATALLDEVSDGLTQVATALSQTPRTDDPQIRAALTQLVPQAQTAVENLQALLASGDPAAMPASGRQK